MLVQRRMVVARSRLLRRLRTRSLTTMRERAGLIGNWPTYLAQDTGLPHMPMSGRINVGVGLFLPPDYARAAASSYSVFIALQTRPHRMIADGFCGAATMHNRWLAVRLSAKRA